MNIFFRAYAHAYALRLLLLAASAPVWIAPARAQQAASTLGDYRVQADLLSITRDRGKLSGNVRLFSPRPDTEPFLDVSAGLITADSIRPLKARAENGVSLVYRTVQAKAGKASSRISIEAKAQNATLDFPARGASGRRVLRLLGGVDGFYEIDGARSSLRGANATVSLGEAPGDVQIAVEGGAGGIELALPAQSFGQVSLGALTLKASRVEQKDGVVSLEGGANGASLKSEGPAVFQVSAPAFNAVLGQGANGRGLSRLASRGRASISFELPPEDARKLFNGPDGAGAAVPDQAQASSSSIPVRLQVSADNALVEPDAQTQRLTLTLTGNVLGSYDLREVSSAGQALAEPVSYPFSGAKAIIKLIPAGEGQARPDFDLEITGSPGKQLQLDLPAFNLKP